MTLFLFLLAKAALAYFPSALYVALRPLFPFQQAQYVQVFPLKLVPFCKLFAGLGSTNKSATSLLSPPSPLLHLSFYFNLSDRCGRNCVVSHPVLLGHNGFPDTYFPQGKMQLMSWADGECYLCALQSHVVSHIHSFLFSDWRHPVSSKFFNTQVPSISTNKLVLPHHACCVLSSLCCNGHSLLLSSYFSRIGRIKNPSCSACGHLS